MSDKSFGDHTNRNIVKNPLLSTAVTGLSLEDLTHNAVLLPVAQSQELITRQDQQTGFQSISLGQPEPRHSRETPIINRPPSINPQNDNSTGSKASKSDDDFDVEEYFARLQGTRYVSAPLNSNQDPQALQAEENLEEINLNEPEQSPVESQGITADIAQNFSQLPTVLPQVASAVFSSFSNMLNYKSREVTPDERPGLKADERPGFKPEDAGVRPGLRVEDVGVPLMGVDEPVVQREVAPPPREMPVGVGGATNFRITTKKKAYAQIPGLSSAAGSQMPAPNPGHIPLNPGRVPTQPEHIPPLNPGHLPAQQPGPMPGDLGQMPGHHHQHMQGQYTEHMQCQHSGHMPSQSPEQTPDQHPGHAGHHHEHVHSHALGQAPGHPPSGHGPGHPPTGHPFMPGYQLVPKTVDGKQHILVFPPCIGGRQHSFLATNPTNINTQIPGLGYADISKPEHVKVPTARTTPTMYHEYVKQGQKERPAFSNINESTPGPLLKGQGSYQGDILQPGQQQGQLDTQPQQQHRNVAQELNIFNRLEAASTESTPRDTSHSGAPILDNLTKMETREDNPIAESQGAALNTSQLNANPLQTQKQFEQPNTDIKILNPLESHDTTSQSKETNHTLNTFCQNTQNKESNKDNTANLFTTVDQKAQQSFPLGLIQEPARIPSTSIIPPPPMFSNLPRRDSQTSAGGKSVLPPSVARRIGANHPIIKPQIQPPSIPTGNIFIPSSVPDQGASPVSEPPQAEIPESTVSIPSAFVQFHASSPSVVNTKSGFRDGGITGLNIPYNQPPLRYSNDGTHESPPVWFPDPNQSPQPPAPQSNHGTVGLCDPNEQSRGYQLPERKVIAVHCLHQYGYECPSEAPKPPASAEPPKGTGNLNFRMTKKRPQYYSGPIEGVGAISNNVKPVIPTAETSAFQGALFTPNQQPPEQSPAVKSAPFDISQPRNVTPNAQFDITQPQAKIQPEYNTAFDLSRPAAQTYEQKHEPQESKGFGIIGSLKSKLSALDINKIQNTVTTFFDPAYNESKKEPEATGSSPYQGSTPSFGQQDSSLEIFVPTTELSQTYTQGYNSQLNYPTYNYSQSNQYYQNQAYYTPNQSYQAQGYAYPVYGSYVPTSVPENTATYTNTYGQVSGAQTVPQSTGTYPNTYGQVTEPQVIDERSSANYLPSNISTYANVPDQSTEIQANLIQPPPAVLNTEVTQQTVQPQIETKPEEPVAQERVLPEQELPKPETSTAETHTEEVPTQDAPKETGSVFVESTYNTYNLFLNNNEAISTPVSIFAQINVDINKNNPKNTVAGNTESQASLNFFDNQKFQSAEKTEVIKSKDMTISQEKKTDSSTNVTSLFNNNLQPEITSGTDFFENIASMPKESSFGVDVNKNDAIIPETDLGHNLLQIQETQAVPTLDVSSVPLFDLSTMLADRTKEMNIIEDTIKNLTLEDKPAESAKLDSSSSADFFENISTVPQPLTDEETEGVSDLSICETCREVSKPEEKEVDDVTKQLIENITSPIQLSNPVVAPLTESNTPVEVPTDFESKQCAEISHITEETIETIQVQSANELLDDITEVANTNPPSYGWNAENDYVNPEVLLGHDYTFQMDPTSLGFYGTNAMFFENIPNNASDELKAEFKSSQEDTPVPLVTQLSVPSAPPAEDDDTKSDETGGLDVHSIEQDAKKDFPIYEEFVIEPSETDDDKIEFKERERSSEDPVPDVDSFTNRVEKFKQMEETDKNEELTEEQKNMLFDIASASQNIASPAISIASYFDTGNFAVESHYRNSLSSPSALHFQMGSPELPMRIPPGFENEFKRRLSGLIAQDNTMHDTNTDINKLITQVPETSTQTKPINTTTYSSVSNVAHSIVTTTASSIQPFIAEDIPKQEEIKLPAFASVFGRHDSGDAASSIATEIEETKEIASSFFAPEPEKTDQKLPDPISFFSTQDNQEPDNNLNRLASYFASPAKTDPEKSFFELSQSQNHYRHSTSTNNTNNLNSNIPNVYLANLMKDLTSPQNIVTTKDQVIRTVNYFTVEYDNDEMKSIKLGDLKKEDFIDKANISYPIELEETNLNDDKLLTVVSKCKFCCSIDSERVVTLNKIEIDNVDFKFKKAMDNEGSEPSRTGGSQTEGKKDDKRRDVTVTFDSSHEDSDRVAMLTENRSSSEYSPVKHHWFYRVDVEGKSIWRGFSATDSRALEDAFHSPDLNENTVVATDGGRFDVNVMGRLRIAVYWPDKPTNVRRCSWFYKGATLYVPYTEPVAEKLEEEYRHGITTGEWHRRLVLPNNESVVMHGPQVMVHFPQSATDTFGSAPESTMRPRVVRRGCDETEIEDPEPSSIDHLLLLCHGVGSACDMRFRSVEEVVDDFRATSLQLVQSHYRNSYDKGVVNRVEVLPISWHSTLHSGETGVDKRLAAITLESIPRLRSFTNDTVLDVLLYTSPVFCQTIIDTVCAELNRIYKLFKLRNPTFKGRVSLGGHSLGSVILYDLLCHQIGGCPTAGAPDKSYLTGPAGTGQPSVNYPSLEFTPAALYAFGSPIAMFECIRGVKSLGADFSLPTCKNFFNIFHPYDPIAYRIEPLINSQLGDVKPYLIPHHKGRKRMHLELKDTMARVGADLKQKLLESLKATWTSMWKSQPPPNDGQLEKVVEEEIEKEQLCDEIKEEPSQNEDIAPTPEALGQLNAGRRVDYVLQEAPFEMINEYLFAMSSHVCYWESEDTMLLMLREIYDTLGVQPDCTVPQNSMTVHRTRTQDDTVIITGTPEHPSTSREGT